MVRAANVALRDRFDSRLRDGSGLEPQQRLYLDKLRAETEKEKLRAQQPPQTAQTIDPPCTEFLLSDDVDWLVTLYAAAARVSDGAIALYSDEVFVGGDWFYGCVPNHTAVSLVAQFVHAFAARGPPAQPKSFVFIANTEDASSRGYHWYCVMLRASA